MIRKTTVLERTASHLQRELNRLETEKEKVRKALASVQAIFGTGSGIRAAHRPRVNGRVAKTKAKPVVHRKYNGPERVCPICHETFKAWRRDQTFCAKRPGCMSNGRAAAEWRDKQRAKQEAKQEKKGTVLLPGDPLRP